MNSRLFSGSLDIDISNQQDMKDVLLSLTEQQKRRVSYYTKSVLPKVDGRIHARHFTSYLYQIIESHIFDY